jgi:hypothetical protein
MVLDHEQRGFNMVIDTKWWSPGDFWICRASVWRLCTILAEVIGSLLGGLEHDFYFSLFFPILGIIIPTDELHHFSEG